MDIPQEDLHGCRSLDPEWPYQGRIEFQNVTLRYKPSLPAALRDISFTILGGAQVCDKIKTDEGMDARWDGSSFFFNSSFMFHSNCFLAAWFLFLHYVIVFRSYVLILSLLFLIGRHNWKDRCWKV